MRRSGGSPTRRLPGTLLLSALAVASSQRHVQRAVTCPSSSTRPFGGEVVEHAGRSSAPMLLHFVPISVIDRQPAALPVERRSSIALLGKPYASAVRVEDTDGDAVNLQLCGCRSLETEPPTTALYAPLAILWSPSTPAGLPHCRRRRQARCSFYTPSPRRTWTALRSPSWRGMGAAARPIQPLPPSRWRTSGRASLAPSSPRTPAGIVSWARPRAISHRSHRPAFRTSCRASC